MKVTLQRVDFHVVNWKIPAIKAYRFLTDSSLSDSKKFIESLEFGAITKFNVDVEKIIYGSSVESMTNAFAAAGFELKRLNSGWVDMLESTIKAAIAAVASKLRRHVI